MTANTTPTMLSSVPALNAGTFNTFGNAAVVTTPIAIGFMVKINEGSFAGALALVALVSYPFIVGSYASRFEPRS